MTRRRGDKCEKGETGETRGRARREAGRDGERRQRTEGRLRIWDCGFEIGIGHRVRHLAPCTLYP
ncbi:MAG: hypothetical protein PVI74_11660, partial [Syntrophobacterales bacterium]